MKKLFLAAACALAICAVSCSKSPQAKAEALVNEFAEKIEKAQSIDEIQTLSMEFAKEAQTFAGDKVDENAPGMKKALEKLQQATISASMRLAQ